MTNIMPVVFFVAVELIYVRFMFSKAIFHKQFCTKSAASVTNQLQQVFYHKSCQTIAVVWFGCSVATNSLMWFRRDKKSRASASVKGDTRLF